MRSTWRFIEVCAINYDEAYIGVEMQSGKPAYDLEIVLDLLIQDGLSLVSAMRQLAVDVDRDEIIFIEVAESSS